MKVIFLNSLYQCRAIILAAYLIFFASILLTSSCAKEEYVDAGEAMLSVELEGIDLDGGSALKLLSATKQSVSSTVTQKMTVALNSNLNMVATLTPVVNPAYIKDKLKVSGKTMATSGTTPVNAVLETGVKYRLVVYDANNNYVTDRVYSKGEENNNVFYLEVGKTYTFLSYSINSKITVPPIDSSKKLTAATLTNIDGDGYFLYFKKTVTLVKGENYLGIKLKHLFSEITTTLDASALTGNIISCSAQVSPHYASLGVNLADGVLVTTGNAGSKNISFSGFNEKTVTSTATKIALSTTSAGVITLSSIQVGSITKSNLVLNNLSIQPGVRYTLTLKMQAAGVNGIDIGPNYIWAPGNLVYNNGAYGFATNQSDKGDLWRLNSLDPYPGGNTHWQTQYKVDTDPCTKVTSHGGGWRTPSYNEFASVAGKKHGDMPMYHVVNASVKVRAQYKGVNGVFIGTNSQPSESDLDKYLFLPYAGSNGGDRNSLGSYWTITPTGSNHYRFQFNLDDVSFFTGDYHVSGSSIRCVKSK